MLAIENLTCGYGKAIVLRDVNLKVDDGEFVSIVGPNGAGKTTLLRTISGLIKPAGGKVFHDGDDITGSAPHLIARKGITHCPEKRRLAPEMTTLENLEMGAYSRKDKRQIELDMQEVFDMFPILRERKNQAAGTLSGGEQQMLALGRALMSKPKLLLLDEPSFGLAPIVKGTIYDKIKLLRERGLYILLVEQDAQTALRICDRGYFMSSGIITAEGTGAELLSKLSISETYFGLRKPASRK
jgi:branched-chain amino acid transport system ATP-binding protein